MLFNNPIDRQQVPTLARRIYPSTSAIFMKRFEQATSRPYGYLVVDLKSSTPEQDRLHTDIFETLDIRKLDSEDERNLSDVDGESVAHSEDEDEESVDLANEDFINNHGPPGKRRKVELNEERSRHGIWNRRFQDPLRQANIEQFKTKVNRYEEQGYTLDQAIHHAANDDLPYLRKRLSQKYTQFLIDFYELQKDPIQQQILESARTFRNQHIMSQGESIGQAVKLRKDLFVDVRPNHSINQVPLKKDNDTERSEEE